MTSRVNEAILSGKFPDFLKLSNIVPVHKKKDPTDKCNYRPVSILPPLSKVFGKIIYDHHLLSAKLGACSLDKSSLRLLMDYLNSRKQRTKVGSSYSK